ncbi:flagellin FliC [bacterium]|nr:flagellin FliC [bacterium]
MALVINTNVSSLKVNNNLNRATSRAEEAMERMSTGFKINRAADDAAGFMISKGLQTQISGSEVAADNAQNAISILTTAGVLDTIQDNLMRMRDLTLQAMNGGYSASEVAALESEAKARALEIDRQSLAATFNKFNIFDEEKAATDEFVIQVGTRADKATNTISITDVFYSATLSTLTGNVVSGNSASADFIAFTTGTAAAGDLETKDYDELGEILNALDSAIDQVSSRRGIIGSTTNRLNSTIDSLTVTVENLSAANSRIVDADIARESSEYTKQYILQQASASLLTQANQTPSLALSLI